MPLPQFDIFRPRTVEEAVNWLAQNQARGVKPLAGGTDILVDIRHPVIPFGHKPPVDRPFGGIWQARVKERSTPSAFCALWNLPELKGIRIVDEEIHIGSMTTIAELERSELIKRHLSGLWDGAAQLGSALVRNRGTYGGNLCNARPAADTAVPTMALGGRLKAVSVRGERWIEHSKFTTGPGQTVLSGDELVVEIALPLKLLHSGGDGKCGSAYFKLGDRKSLEIAIVGAAASLELDGRGRISAAAIALGAVAPTVILASEAAAAMIGESPSERLFSEIGRLAADEAHPITDHRGGAGYRLQMIKVLVRRALDRSLARAVSSAESLV